jgi:hypothetical protein
LLGVLKAILSLLVILEEPLLIVLGAREVLVIRWVQIGVPIGLTWHVHIVESLQVLEEIVRDYPCIQEFISFQYIDEQLKVSHVKFLFRRFTSLVIQYLQVKNFFGNMLHELLNENFKLIDRQVHLEKIED